jgi:hypothetical protein
MQKVLLTAVAALALGVPTAKAGTWWILDSADGACVPATRAVNVTRNSSFASPFTLAAEMRRQGRLNALTDQKRTAYGSAYGVHYDGVVTPYFTAKGACEEFLGGPRRVTLTVGLYMDELRSNDRGQEALAQARNVAADMVPPPSRAA